MRREGEHTGNHGPGKRAMDDKIRILVVDDEPDIRQVVRLMLEAKGYEVYLASNGAEAVECVKSKQDMDLVIMDIMMPGISGVEACRLIREISTVPVLFLTARTQDADKVDAYDSGGDDYLGKPFSQAELLAKVSSLVRRYRNYRGKPESADEIQGLRLLKDKNAVAKEGETIDLTNVEYSILEFLMKNRGRPISAQCLYEGVWKEKYLPSSSNTVMVHILNLRKKIEKDAANPKIIHTVWGKGYQIG